MLRHKAVIGIVDHEQNSGCRSVAHPSSFLSSACIMQIYFNLFSDHVNINIRLMITMKLHPYMYIYHARINIMHVHGCTNSLISGWHLSFLKLYAIYLDYMKYWDDHGWRSLPPWFHSRWVREELACMLNCTW